MMRTWRNKTEFKDRVRHWAAKLDVDVRSLAVRPMKNKWASCSTKGFLNFNSELLDFEKDVGDYVIVHELLHFFVPNHGKVWKSLMRAHLGDYEKMAEKLKKAYHHTKFAANQKTALLKSRQTG
jgi:predicted metal-dependent hydrolase